MKYLVASDLHGELFAYQLLLERAEEENADKIILLGDLDNGRNIAAINTVLDQIKVPIFAVEGNCDSEEKLKLFHVENKGTNMIEYVDKRCIFFTHGHIYGIYNMPSALKTGDIFLYGHWHEGALGKENGVFFGNAGSLARPRNGSKASYIIINEAEMFLKDGNSGEIIKKQKLC